MKRNLDTEESRRFWEFVRQTAERVNRWPKWKQHRVVLKEGK